MPSNARALVAQYDVVLDCTDHPAARYLVSDACVLLGKPLVSASALRTAGQLAVLNSPPGAGPCYRCVFPRPPPPAAVVGCGEGGILGPVVGVMGVLQALEAIRLLVAGPAPRPPRMLLLTAALDAAPSFRSARLRLRRPDCPACSRRLALDVESTDYVAFCGAAPPVALLAPGDRVTPEQYRDIRAAAPPHVLVDVRDEEHFSLGSIPGAVNVPMSRFTRCGARVPDEIARHPQPNAPIYVVCRVGNDSQVVAQRLKDLGLGNDGERFIGDIAGGIKAWRDAVDPTLPFL